MFEEHRSVCLYLYRLIERLDKSPIPSFYSLRANVKLGLLAVIIRCRS